MADNIPDGDLIYHRVHKTHFKDDVLNLRLVFKDIGGAMSTDWAALSTPQESQNRGKIPADNGVLGMNVGKVRAIPHEVRHEPSAANISHTNVYGEKTDKALIKYSRIWNWEIKPPPI
jgi:hypothetical protein